MSNNNSFGDRLKALRKSKKLTQVQVSEMIDVQQGTYSRWENGTLEPNLEAVVKLAKLFDTTTDYLLGKTTYSTLDVVPHPITKIDLKKLKEFNPASFFKVSNSTLLKLGLYNCSQSPRNSMVFRFRIQFLI